MELTRFTIYQTNQHLAGTVSYNHKFTLSIVAAGSNEVARTRERALTDTSPELVVSTTAKALWYVSGTAASAENQLGKHEKVHVCQGFYL